MGFKRQGLVIAAPHSGSGKTTLTIGLLRALKRSQVAVAPAKIGPDYIDPQYHEVAAGVRSCNLDGWAMRPALLASLADQLQEGGDLSVIEGVMGLFDGAVKRGVLGYGATADVARFYDLPVVLVVDCAGMGQSVAALVKGFACYDPSIKLAGVILNKLGSLRHVTMMTKALEVLGVPVLGAVPRDPVMELPSRHLGLVQPEEMAGIERQIDAIADHVAAHVDLETLSSIAGSFSSSFSGARGSGAQGGVDGFAEGGGMAPLGQRIAVARDGAFRFFYPHLSTAWRQAGAELVFFSPLANEGPDRDADAVYLPGGYPELYAGKIASNETFKAALKTAAEQGARIYGECGGYMVLGDGLVDKEGHRHSMAGLLRLETSFADRKLHLGYRHVARVSDGQLFRGHEFHYATILRQEGTALFQDVEGEECYGLADGPVSGSFVHLID